jgi:hypothetical protein
MHKETVMGREAAEVDALVRDLRTQVSHLAKANASLKNKAVFFKTLHESEARKRSPYDHIPPRISNRLSSARPRSSSGKHLQPTLAMHPQ